MVKQYPHYLYTFSQAGNSTRDEKGNWVPAGSSWSFHSVCREETNGKGSVIQGIDGKSVVFSSLILCPRGTAKIPDGTNVRVVNTKDENGEKRIERPVLNSDPGQLHTRVWV